MKIFVGCQSNSLSLSSQETYPHNRFDKSPIMAMKHAANVLLALIADAGG